MNMFSRELKPRTRHQVPELAISYVAEAVTLTSDTPVVSIGLPVFNGERYLENAIESLLSQSFGDFELIICDNASSDQTAQICASYIERDPRVRYIRNPRNLGAGPNFDLAFQHARGEFFQWAAHDDMFAPTYLERAVGALRANPDAALCTVGITEIGSDGVVIRSYTNPLDGAGSRDPVERFASVIHTRHQCEEFFGLYRRSVLVGSGLVGAFSGSDRVLLAEIAIRGRWLRLPESLFLHREHAQRATRAILLVDRKRAALWQDATFARHRMRTLFHVMLYREYWRLIAKNVPEASQRVRFYRQLMMWWLTDEHFTDVVRDILQDVSPRMLGWARATKHALIRVDRVPPPGSLPTLKP